MIKASELRIGNYYDYKVCENGVVFCKNSDREMKLFINENGYANVSLFINGNGVTRRVHRIIAEVFIANPENKKTVNHRDFNKLNNNVSNLEWATSKEQRRHTLINGRGIGDKRDNVGVKNSRAKITESDVFEIRKLYNAGKLKLPEIGRLFGINRFTVSNIANKRTWKHLS